MMKSTKKCPLFSTISLAADVISFVLLPGVLVRFFPCPRAAAQFLCFRPSDNPYVVFLLSSFLYDVHG